MGEREFSWRTLPNADGGRESATLTHGNHLKLESWITPEFSILTTRRSYHTISENITYYEFLRGHNTYKWSAPTTHRERWWHTKTKRKFPREWYPKNCTDRNYLNSSRLKETKKLKCIRFMNSDKGLHLLLRPLLLSFFPTKRYSKPDIVKYINSSHLCFIDLQMRMNS